MIRSTRAFTFTDLIVSLAALVLLFGAFLPTALGRSRSSGNWVKCASNLRQIAQAIELYALANGGSLPRGPYDGQGVPLAEYTGALATDPFGQGGPAPNDVTAALFLLARAQSFPGEVFICPSDVDAERWDYEGRTPSKTSNFPSSQFLSYSFLNVYPTPAAVGAGFAATLPTGAAAAEWPLAADMNPGGSAVVEVTPRSPRQQMVQANSRNHGGDGQTVLYADGHVEMQNTPFCGLLRKAKGDIPQFRDNIYTYGSRWGATSGAGVRGSPVDALDNVLLPTALDGPRRGMNAPTRRMVAFVVIGAVVIGVLLLLALRRKRRAGPSPNQ